MYMLAWICHDVSSFQVEERIAEAQFLRDELGRKEAEWCEAEERYKKEHENLLAAFNRLQAIVSRVQADLPGIQQATDYLQARILLNNIQWSGINPFLE